MRTLSKLAHRQLHETYDYIWILYACREMPGLLQKVMEWFRDYKIPAGKPENKYGFDSKCLDAAFTKNVIEECHGFYKACLLYTSDAADE